MSAWTFFGLAIAAFAFQRRRRAHKPSTVIQYAGEILIALLVGSICATGLFFVLRGLGFDLSGFN